MLRGNSIISYNPTPVPVNDHCIRPSLTIPVIVYINSGFSLFPKVFNVVNAITKVETMSIDSQKLDKFCLKSLRI